jgi:hypothetical protein
MQHFNYSGKTIIGLSKYRSDVNAEIDRVKHLSPAKLKTQKWVGIRKRPRGSLYENDLLREVKGISKSMEMKINNCGIMNVMEFSIIPEEDIREVAKALKTTQAKVTAWIEDCKNAEAGTSPFPQYYDYVQGHDNPYLARYGKENWRREINKSSHSGLNGTVCVTELIRHMEKHTKAAYAGTEYKNSYMWSHDSLTQMTDAACRQWMRKIGVWKRWVKPELGLNDSIPFVNKNGETEITTRYKKRPVGDQPELMPHDSSLNYDVDRSLSLHVMMTSHLDDSDPLKMSKRTPSEIVKCIDKLCHPVTGVVPKPERIVQDVKKVPNCLIEIIKHGGLIVPGLVNRNGHRAKGANKGRTYNSPRKDQRIQTLDEIGIFPEVQEVAKEFIQGKELKFDQRKLDIEID